MRGTLSYWAAETVTGGVSPLARPVAGIIMRPYSSRLTGPRIDTAMNFDPLDDNFGEMPVQDDEWALYRLFSRVAFDALVRDIVRGHYAFRRASHVTLHLEDGEATLFVREGGHTIIQQDSALSEWALEFLAGDVLNLPVEDVSTVYLDGAVGGTEPYLYVAGDGILLATGEPNRKGRFL